MKRTCGILLPVSSLPSPWGIGTLGEQAYRFVDFLAAAGQHYWQILPLGPIGYGDSPYQSFSAFAANPYYIDLETLIGEGLLQRGEVEAVFCGDDSAKVDYGALYAGRFGLLRLAADRFDTGCDAYADFVAQNMAWLPDYALFMALKTEHGMVSFTEWPEPLRRRDADALLAARIRLEREIRYWQICQFLFYTQWHRLKSYAGEHGVKIIGDLPIYVSPDSSDLWAARELFQTNENGELTEVAGCPPDAFSEEGQLWGNPLYDWQQHLDTGCAWWIRRMRHAGEVYDVVRIDHFRGFESYYAIPAGAKNAVGGSWREGPGMKLIEKLKAALPELPIIAEDLGYQTDALRRMLAESGFPGMKVLQFAFDSREESDYLPHNYNRNSVVYTGTHDNPPTADWQYSAPPQDAAFARRYLGLQPGEDLTRPLVRAALASVSDICIIPLQDYLGLGKEARMNTPSTLGGNWQWRVQKDVFTPAFAEELRELAGLYGRT